MCRDGRPAPGGLLVVAREFPVQTPQGAGPAELAADAAGDLAGDFGLTVTPGTGGATVSGSGTSSVTIIGTAAQIAALLNTNATGTVSFFANTDVPPATATITLAANDGHGQSSSTSLVLSIQNTPETGSNTPTAGDDTINGGDGNDSLIGGAGTDFLDGEPGATGWPAVTERIA